MKKQVKKISKKILVLGLATSIIFTSCFSHKKIDAHASSVAVGLGAYTLYEICLYIGGLAVTTLGIGYAYENRDEIAEFGKTVIDSLTNLPTQGWLFGSKTSNGDYVYGSEALQEVQQADWTVIQGGGQSPKNDNDGDGDEDLDDVNLELNMNGYFLTSAGVGLFQNFIKPLYDEWKNGGEDNVLQNKYGSYENHIVWDPNNIESLKNSDGYYESVLVVRYHYDTGGYSNVTMRVTASEVIPFFVYKKSSGITYYGWDAVGHDVKSGYMNDLSYRTAKEDFFNSPGYLEIVSCNVPIFLDKTLYNSWKNNKIDLTDISTDNFYSRASYVVSDWIKEEDDSWKGHLEDIATSLRSLQDLISISQRLSESAYTTQPNAEEYGDMIDDISSEYDEKTDPIVAPIYYPLTNTTPQLEPSDFPNYQPPSGGSDSDGGSDEDIEIDLDGLTSIFNIIFYLIMIIIMLIYLFISCLAFIVMIFRIPASYSMLPQDMVLGYEHLQTIMIPGMNISIYSFAMALIYLFIIFAIIKLIRLEINDFKFPRSYK